MRISLVLLFVALTTALAGPAIGQAASVVATAAVPPIHKRYYDLAGKEIPTAEGADHYEDQIYRDSVGGTVRVYYPSGKLRRIVPYAHFNFGVKYGAETSFYETGEVKSRCEYNLAGPVGYYIQFYRTGRVRSRTPIGNDLPLDAKGEAFGPDGEPYAKDQPHPQDKMPTLHGGQANILYAVQRAVRYPAAALRAQVTGRVFVSFLVDDAGFVRNVYVLSSPSPLLNPAVLAAVGSLGRFMPGEAAGDPVDVFFTLPVTFAIN